MQITDTAGVLHQIPMAETRFAARRKFSRESTASLLFSLSPSLSVIMNELSGWRRMGSATNVLPLTQTLALTRRQTILSPGSEMRWRKAQHEEGDRSESA